MAAPSNNPNSVVALGNFDRTIKIMATSSDDIVANLDVLIDIFDKYFEFLGSCWWFDMFEVFTS